jgi:hypothetical protein
MCLLSCSSTFTILHVQLKRICIFAILNNVSTKTLVGTTTAAAATTPMATSSSSRIHITMIYMDFIFK